MINLYQKDKDAFYKSYVYISKEPFQFLSSFISLYNHILYKQEIKIPILFDATCSGIQHLASLIQDVELASKVNLIVKSPKLGIKIVPADIYNELRKPINEEIRKTGRENPA